MNSADAEYCIKLTYAELYNEELKDLLSPTPNENLKIIDDPQLGPLIQNITEANFTTAAEVKKVLEEGENRRHFGVTNMNAHSSRSHVLVRLSIEMRKVPYKPTNPLRTSWGRDKPTCISTLNLVDLAGSERATKSGTSGQSLKEGSFINKSLLTLGTVISNLSEGKSGQHVPYRNSKLTRLLASALGGNAKTLMITCISPASGNIVESLSTLRFASRAKRIVNQVQKNETMDAKSLATKLAHQAAEMEQLRSQLELSKQLGFVPGDGDEQQGETLKEKAVNASKNFRSFKFLMQNIPKMALALKREGKPHLAKKAQEFMKSAVAGTREVTDIIAELSTMITAHLPKEVKLLTRIHDLEVQNDAGVLVSESDAQVDPDSDDDDPEQVFAGLDMGVSDELMEELESVKMGAEDFRV